MKRLTLMEIEMRETMSMARSLCRLRSYRLHHRAWKRALIHAIMIQGELGDVEVGRVREALSLP